MLLALLLCIALPKTSSAQRVSVVLENVSLAEALKKVSAASGYEFFYNSNVVLKSDKRITASFEGTELKTVLDHVFSGTEFSYRIKDRTIVVVPRPAQPAPEEPTDYLTLPVLWLHPHLQLSEQLPHWLSAFLLPVCWLLHLLLHFLLPLPLLLLSLPLRRLPHLLLSHLLQPGALIQRSVLPIRLLWFRSMR